MKYDIIIDSRGKDVRNPSPYKVTILSPLFFDLRREPVGGVATSSAGTPFLEKGT